MAKVAFLVGPDFEDSELTVPRDELQRAGHEVVLLGTKGGESLKGKKGRAEVRTDAAAADRDPAEFDALVIPGGYSPDKLRTDESVVSFLERFAETGRPIAAICHAASLLVEADLVRGRTLTSWPSVRKDVENAGGEWVDRELVRDGQLVTSRKPDDLDAFCGALLEDVAKVGTPSAGR